MTEMTSVGTDFTMCLCATDEVNSIVEMDRKESGHDGCCCHNAS